MRTLTTAFRVVQGICVLNRPPDFQSSMNGTYRLLSILVVLAGYFGISSASAVAQVDATTKPVLVLQTGHTGIVNAMALSSDGRWLASGGSDDAVKIWDTETGLELRSLYG